MKIALTLLFPVLICAQPMDWVHYFVMGESQTDPMWKLYFSSNNDLWCSRLDQAGLKYKFTVLSADSISSCKTNIPQVNLSSDIGTYLVSRITNRLYLFAKDTIYIKESVPPFSTVKTMSFDCSLQVISALELSDGRVFLSTSKCGIYSVANGAITKLPSPDSSVYIDFEDQGKVWATSMNGAYLFSENKWTCYNKSNSGLSCDRFMNGGKKCIKKDNMIFAGTADSGLFTFDGAVWTKYSPYPSGTPESRIRCLAIDSTGALWIGSNYGIMRYFNGVWYKYTREDYEGKNAAFGNSVEIVTDRYNRVWISMLHQGIYMLEQSETSNCSDVKAIKIRTPSKNSTFKKDDTITVSWNTYGTINKIQFYYKQSSTDNWNSFPAPYSNVINNTQELRWKLSVPVTNECYIKICDAIDSTVQDVSGVFSIVNETQNNYPVFSNIPDTLKVNQNTAATYTFNATDADNDKVTYQAQNLPAWATFKDSTLVINPDNSAAAQTIMVIVSDEKGGCDTAKITIIPVPPVENYQVNKQKFNNSIKLTITKNSIQLFAGNTKRNDVKKAVIFNCIGKKIIEIEPVDNCFSLNRTTTVLGKGTYNCVVYTATGKIVYNKIFQIVD